MLNITKENFETEVEQADSLVVIDLYADWCGPCKMLAPVMEELEREYPDVKFGKINVDNEPDLTALFKVQSIPYIALVKDNTFVDMSIGFVPKENIKRLIEDNK